jgi:tetratricopeptide (TPR) repeat protein
VNRRGQRAALARALLAAAPCACGPAGDVSSFLDKPAPAAAPSIESALALRRAGRVEEARRAYEELARQEPRDALAWWGWAELLRHDLRDWRGAENAYLGALEADPLLVGARWDHATLLARLGRHDEASISLEALLRDLPPDSPLRGPAELLATETRLRRIEAGR